MTHVTQTPPAASPRRPKSASRGATYVISAALLFGINGSVSKVVIGAGVSPAQLTLFRVLSTAIIAGAVLLITDRKQFRPSGAQLIKLAALGVIGLAMIQWLYSVAISILPVGVALLIQYTAVVFVALAAWLLFSERVHPRLWIAIGAVLVGLAIVAQIWDSDLRLLGVAAAFGAALTYAFYFLMGERAVAAMSPMAVAFWASTFATVFWGVFSEWWALSPGTLASQVELPGGHVAVAAWVPLLYVITLGSFLPFVLMFTALDHLSATAVGILAAIEVLFAFVVAWLWLGEALTALQIAGAALVLIGIVIAQTARSRPTADVPAHTMGDAVEAPPAVP